MYRKSSIWCGRYLPSWFYEDEKLFDISMLLHVILLFSRIPSNFLDTLLNQFVFLKTQIKVSSSRKPSGHIFTMPPLPLLHCILCYLYSCNILQLFCCSICCILICLLSWLVSLASTPNLESVNKFLLNEWLSKADDYSTLTQFWLTHLVGLFTSI